MVSTKQIAGIRFPKSDRRDKMNLSQEDVIENIVLHSPRYGPSIRLQQLSSVPENPREEQLLAQVEAEIERRKGKSSPRRLQSLEAKAEVLRITSGFHRVLPPNRDPTCFQVLAVPAIRYGLNSPQLEALSRAMGNIELNYKNMITWEGNARRIQPAIRKRLPYLTEQLLYNNPNRSLDSEEILVGLGLRRTTENYSLLNVCLQLLEVSGYVKKQPHHAFVGDTGHLSVWAHRAYDNPFPRHPNPMINVLDLLYNNGQPRTLISTQLISQPVPTHLGGDGVSGFGMTGGGAIYSSVLPKLAESDLITWSGRLEDFGEIALTDHGIRYMREMYDSNHLPEGLRKLLLGQKRLPPEIPLYDNYEILTQLFQSARQVLGNTRPSLNTENTHEPEALAEDDLLPEIDQLMIGVQSISPRRLKAREDMRSVIETTRAFHLLLPEGDHPSCFEVLAPTIINHGLGSRHLRDMSNAMISLHSRGWVTWTGGARIINTPIREGIPQKLEDALTSPGKGKTIDDLITLARLPKNANVEKHAAASLLLLEAAGIARRQPRQSVMHGSAPQIWTHSGNPNPIPDYPNTQIHILRLLYNKGAPQTLNQKQVIEQPDNVDPNNPFSYDSGIISRRSAYLRDKGLISIERMGSKTLLHLQPSAIEYMREMEETGQLPEDLRKLLVFD